MDMILECVLLMSTGSYYSSRARQAQDPDNVSFILFFYFLW